MSENKQTVRLENLSIGYRGKSSVKEVACDINASLFAGELTCLIGPNGVGKSTLMRTVCAFQEKLSGSIFIDGKELEKYQDKELSKKIGVVLTHRPQIQNMTVKELVALGRSPYTGFWGRLEDEDKRIVSKAISLIGIENLRSRMIQNLSDGERQKVVIAKAIAQQTPIICLDEPTAFLDFPSKIETMQLLKKLAKENGKTIFLSTHDLELTLQIADRIWLMQKGNITTGTPEEVAQCGALSEFIEREGITFDKSQMRVKISR
ncbi:MAG: ABC transporter ATP-binding protein [Bacteroidales bacterium]|nr:ABC transporter ATP-binding protein [Bacteroidales bacterium]